MQIATLLISLTLSLMLAACSHIYIGPAYRSFYQPGYHITFEYPSELELISDVPETDHVPRPDCATESPPTMLLLEGYDTLVTFWCKTRDSAASDHIELFKKKLDRSLNSAYPGLPGGVRIEAGGLPGLAYSVPMAPLPGAQMRYIALFDKDIEYVIECQSTPQHRDEMDRACQRVLDTIQRR